MTKPLLDAIDRAIIERLSDDARLTNRTIADSLGVTEGTIRARLKRLREARLIRFTALTNLSRVGRLRVAFIRVRTRYGAAREVAEAIAEMDEIKCVIITTGGYQVIAMSPMLNLEREIETLTGRIGALPGVAGTQTSLSLEVVKYNVRSAKILSPQRDGTVEEDVEEDG